MTGPAIESELKLIADGDAPLAGLATRERLGHAGLGLPRTVDEMDRYLDTSDHRLASLGWACRLRRREGSTTVSLKGPARHAEGAVLHERPEMNGPATDQATPSAWPPSEARELLDAMSGGEPLVEQFTLVQARTEREVLMDGLRVGILSLDRVRVVSAGVGVGVLHVVELELDPATGPVSRDADHLARALEQIEGLRPDPMTKIQHALSLIGRFAP